MYCKILWGDYKLMLRLEINLLPPSGQKKSIKALDVLEQAHPVCESA